MHPITLAVVSDLHVGSGSRAIDLCPVADEERRDADYRRKFLEFLRKENKRADYLVLPGDVTHGSQAAELALAGDVISEIAVALGTTADKTVFVPGNHDGDWSRVRAEDTSDIRLAMKYYNLRQNAVFNGILLRSNCHLLDQPHYSIWETEELLVVGYNSAWQDEPTIQPHHGIIADQHLRELRERLETIPLNRDQLRLFLVHHHPIQYSDPLPDEPDFSALTNAGNLMDVLHRAQFDLLIHGHKHKPNFETHSVDGAFPLAILGAGSFSAYLDSRWSGYVNNQFHLINIAGRDGNSGVVRGTVESWTFLSGHAWVPSQDNNGIAHVLPFGTYTQPAELRRLVSPIIVREFQGHEYVTWESIWGELPDLQHLPPNRVVELLDSLAIELGFKRHGVDPQKLILLRGI